MAGKTHKSRIGEGGEPRATGGHHEADVEPAGGGKRQEGRVLEKINRVFVKKYVGESHQGLFEGVPLSSRE